jgi:hypothetical protein
MTSQSTGSPRSDSEPAISAISLPAHYVFLAFRWTLLNSRFLYLLAAVLVGGSFLLSFNTDAWHWFQRSGALLVSIGALLSTRRALGLMLDSLINGGDLAQQVQGELVPPARPESCGPASVDFCWWRWVLLSGPMATCWVACCRRNYPAWSD